MTNADIMAALGRERLIAIFRGVEGEQLRRLTAAVFSGGIRFIEVTFRQELPDCERSGAEAIRTLSAMPGIIPGAGTVMNKRQVQAAFDAGAKYIVSPNTDPEVIAEAKRLGLVSIPGALTPTEVAAAYALGADAVKLFPAGTMGLKYFKDLRAPLAHIPIVVTAGITEDNVAGFLHAGALAAGISSPLCNRRLIEDGSFDEIERRSRALYVAAHGLLEA